MRTLLTAICVAIVFAVGGYWLGFRQAWEMGVMVDYSTRGVIAISNTRLLDSQRSSDLRAQFASDIDSGLMFWHEIDRSPLRPALNVLTGIELIPQYETYVRRLAAYRKAHPSPLDDPALIAQMLREAKDKDPAFAAELVEGGKQRQHAIQEVMRKYAP